MPKYSIELPSSGGTMTKALAGAETTTRVWQPCGEDCWPGRRQFGKSHGIGDRENGLPRIVESHQEPSHWPPGGFEILVIYCAHWIACGAIYYAYNITIIMLCVS